MGTFTTDSGSSSLYATIVGDLMQMLDDINQLVKDDCQSNYKLRLIGTRDNDSKQYDDPSSNDIGGLIVGDIGNFNFERDIIIEHCCGFFKEFLSCTQNSWPCNIHCFFLMVMMGIDVT
uniref:Uncharacterized protein n=1 Tax=Salix viminalis TaxID=40686 RepID=A0A6N2KN71_SALVM